MYELIVTWNYKRDVHIHNFISSFKNISIFHFWEEITKSFFLKKNSQLQIDFFALIPA